MLDNKIRLTIELDFIWSVFGKINCISDYEIDSNFQSVFDIFCIFRKCYHFTFRWFFFGISRQDDTTSSRRLSDRRFDQDMVYKWDKIHNSYIDRI